MRRLTNFELRTQIQSITTHVTEMCDDIKGQRSDADLDLDLDNSRLEPEAITATSGCALRKSGEPTLEDRYCVGLSN